MRLEKYDAQTGRHTVELSMDEVNMLHSLADGVHETYRLQDDGLLGLTKRQVMELRDQFETIIHERLRLSELPVGNGQT